MKFIYFLLFILSATTPKNCNKNAHLSKADTQHHETQVLSNKIGILELNGKDVSQEKLFIVFNKEDQRASGFSGCNTFSCKYTEEGDTISLGIAIASKMYCAEKDQLESDFFAAFSLIQKKRVKENTIYLEDDNNNVIVKGSFILDE
ncbi:META domain-containing protein [Aquimarina spongiae]|uniref:Heat shock protein HslJ n=1 Tax=Aquimarina spongiae TaxID=570521 RepID=A0A1M6IU06_9FLAO|nr:META domain-containing protein [Aquimarina spongiae]SHJ37943.1 Heat shock protein HslJ [Aquimarina spongiae]